MRALTDSHMVYYSQFSLFVLSSILCMICWFDGLFIWSFFLITNQQKKIEKFSFFFSWFSQAYWNFVSDKWFYGLIYFGAVFDYRIYDWIMNHNVTFFFLSCWWCLLDSELMAHSPKFRDQMIHKYINKSIHLYVVDAIFQRRWYFILHLFENNFWNDTILS